MEANKENQAAAAEGGKKKMTKEERVAARAAPKQEVESTEEDVSKGLYGLMPLITSKEKVDRQLLNLSELNASLADTKVWVRGRLFVSRKSSSKSPSYALLSSIIGRL